MSPVFGSCARLESFEVKDSGSGLASALMGEPVRSCLIEGWSSFSIIEPRLRFFEEILLRGEIGDESRCFSFSFSCWCVVERVARAMGEGVNAERGEEEGEMCTSLFLEMTSTRLPFGRDDSVLRSLAFFKNTGTQVWFSSDE